MKILYGTKNEAKLASMRRTLSSLNIEIIGLNDLDKKVPEVEEVGNSPLENARIKDKVYNTYNTYNCYHNDRYIKQKN